MILQTQINPDLETEKIVNFIRHTFQSAGKKTALVAVSGGVDSATSLLLAAQALSPEQVFALHLPAKNSAPIHTRHAILAMDAARIPPANRITINIGAIIQKSWRTIKKSGLAESRRQFPLTTQDLPAGRQGFPSRLEGGESESSQSGMPSDNLNRLRLANLAARIRMLVLYDQAKLHQALVIGTENRSEYLLGYFTRFGDEASDLEPLRHLYKTQVIELASHLGVPRTIIDKPPTADLWPGQTDAAELGFTYAEADPILYVIDQHQALPDTPLAKAVQKTVTQNAFKHQVPYHL